MSVLLRLAATVHFGLPYGALTRAPTVTTSEGWSNKKCICDREPTKPRQCDVMLTGLPNPDSYRRCCS